ncbi:histone-like nucleoid-structuring protein Lsr2 [Nocardia fluminea]
MRTWTGENGHNVSRRGRISSEVIAAYDAASA